jgi:hypothetical protein
MAVKWPSHGRYMAVTWQSHGRYTWQALFDSVQLLPVRRPHQSDEVVANLARHKSDELSSEYLEDVERLRRAATQGLLPAHTCM